jgi:hypothetical protein
MVFFVSTSCGTVLQIALWPIESTFLSSAPRFPKQRCFWDGSQDSPVCPSAKSNVQMQTSMVNCWNDSDRGKATYSEKNLSQCQFLVLQIKWFVSTSVLRVWDVTGRGQSERTSVAGRVHLLPGSIRDDVRESWVINIHGRLRHRGTRCVSVCHTVPSIASLSYCWQGKLVPVHAMKASGWMTIVNFTPRPLYPLYLLNRRLGVFQSRSGSFGEEKTPCPCRVRQVSWLWTPKKEAECPAKRWCHNLQDRNNGL